MTANRDIERRLARHYEAEPLHRAPDWVLRSALSAIETTPQRRGTAALRRYPSMPTYMKLAGAAALVIAVGGFALWQLAPAGPGSTPTATPPSASALPTAQPTAAPTARPGPTTYAPGALTQAFTSARYGVSISYPEGWEVRAGTGPWTDAHLPYWTDSTDALYDAVLEDHLFLTVASRPLDGSSLDAWVSGLSIPEGCVLKPGDAIGGADLVLRGTCGSELVLASSGGRGYVFELRASADDVELRSLDAAALFDAILATAQFHPEDAVDQ